MDPEDEIPKPTEVGSAGTQASSTAIAVVSTPVPPLQQLSTRRTLEGLVAAHPYHFGGQIGGTLLINSIARLESDTDEQKEELRRLREENQELRDQRAAGQTRIEVLEERAGSASTAMKIVAACSFLVPTFAAIAIELYKNELTELSYVTGAASFALLCIAMFILWKARK